ADDRRSRRIGLPADRTGTRARARRRRWQRRGTPCRSRLADRRRGPAPLSGPVGRQRSVAQRALPVRFGQEVQALPRGARGGVSPDVRPAAGGNLPAGRRFVLGPERPPTGAASAPGASTTPPGACTARRRTGAPAGA